MQLNNIEDFNVEDRRRRMIEILNREGKVKVIELSKLFGISEVTIRNDLRELENMGMLERVHGGAVSTNRAYFNMDFNDRITKYVEEKKLIAHEAAKLIFDNDTVMLNSGTTTYFVAQELKNRKNLTVVTNSVSVSQELSSSVGFNVILLGGCFNCQYHFTYGDDAICQLKKYKTDKLILSSDGVSADFGITTHHYQEAEVSKVMIERVNQLIVVADYSKIGRENFAFLQSAACIDYLVTNKISPTDEIQRFIDMGIEVKLV